MTPLQTLSIELGPQVAEAALQALMNEAERVREGRPAVRSMIVFFPVQEQREPEWAKGIEADTPCKYNDIHGPEGSQTQ